MEIQPEMSHDPTQSLRRSGIVLLLQLRVQEEEEEESETSHAAQAHNFGSRDNCQCKFKTKFCLKRHQKLKVHSRLK
jgi:hypothetical protein